MTVFSEDTDISCILLHHLYTKRENAGVYLKNTTRKEDTEIRTCIRKCAPVMHLLAVTQLHQSTCLEKHLFYQKSGSKKVPRN